jgi:hypothetical protein
MSDGLGQLATKRASRWNGYALVAAVSNYDQIQPLPAAVLNDASDVASVLTSPMSCGYAAANVRLLLDADASLTKLRNALAWLGSVAGPEDSVTVYFSGHGTRLNDKGSSESALILADSQVNNLRATSLPESEFSAALKAIRSARLLVMLDACHSGGSVSLKASSTPEVLNLGFDEKSLAHLADGVGRAVIASSRATETSLVLPGAHNSAFTQHLLEALRGEMLTRGDGVIRVFDVFDYVAAMVPKSTSDRQHPIFKASELEKNFPVALDKGGYKSEGATRNRQLQNGFDWRELEEIVTDLYPTGPRDQDIWRRAGGDLSRLHLNQSGRAAWFSSLLILKQGGGGDKLSLERLIRAALEDFPKHQRLKMLIISNL